MRLSVREKKMIAICAAAVAVFAMYQVAVRPVQRQTGTYKGVLPQKQSTLVELRQMSAEYKHLQAQLASLKDDPRIAKSGFSPLTAIEQIARQAGVPVASMKPSTSVPGGEYQATNVEVALSRVSMSDLMRLLGLLETSGHPLILRELALRQTPAQPGRADVVLQVRSVQAK